MRKLTVVFKPAQRPGYRRSATFRKLHLSYVPLCLSLVLIIGCSAQKDIGAASAAVVQFHQRLDNQDYLAIYNGADQRFRGASKQDDFVALMTAIHNKLGTVQQASRQGFFFNYNTSGSTIKLTYATKFSGGDADEEFLWGKRGDNFLLVGYHINSNALITK
jgi:hypothetical protein